MTGGPHEGGNASYPVSFDGSTGTIVNSTMTVPDYPRQIDDITYYLWTDVFFGDGPGGMMNQFVPQLLLGDVLYGSSGPPTYRPVWKSNLTTWMFGSHYFFEIHDENTKQSGAHAAYGPLYPTHPGETLYTTFELQKKKPAATFVEVADESNNAAGEGARGSLIA